MLNAWPIYLQNCVVLGVNVGRYTIHWAFEILLWIQNSLSLDMLYFFQPFPSLPQTNMFTISRSLPTPSNVLAKRLCFPCGVVNDGEFITHTPRRMVSIHSSIWVSPSTYPVWRPKNRCKVGGSLVRWPLEYPFTFKGEINPGKPIYKAIYNPIYNYLEDHPI